MTTLNELVRDFLAQRRIAVAGVSRSSGQAANAVYRKLRGSGYEVFAVNPNADEVEGEACHPDLKSVPGGVDGVVVATHPDATDRVLQECAELGISRVWLHRSFGQGSVSDTAVDYCRRNGISVIPGGCPLMFSEPVDFGHRCMRWVLKLTGGLPK
jgi:predicted CoA-binding protein